MEHDTMKSPCVNPVVNCSMPCGGNPLSTCDAARQFLSTGNYKLELVGKNISEGKYFGFEGNDNERD